MTQADESVSEDGTIDMTNATQEFREVEGYDVVSVFDDASVAYCSNSSRRHYGHKVYDSLDRLAQAQPDWRERFEEVHES